MFRIDAQGAVPGLPPPEPPGQVAGYFSKGNPGQGQKATVVSADWANAIQEEIANVIEQAGIALDQQDKSDLTQLKKAILAMIGLGAVAPHDHDASDIVSGTFADTRIADGAITTSKLADQSVNLSKLDLSNIPVLPPIGSIIPFYDFNGALGFDPNHWKYCDGSSHDFKGPLGPQTLPDLSGRYLVGFGSEGGADMATASWNQSAVGNAGHQINLQHSHTAGTLKFRVADIAASPIQFFDVNGSVKPVFDVAFNTGPGSGPHDVFVLHGSAPTNTSFYTTYPQGSTGNALSSTQSIQPRSIRVKYLMRIL